MTKLSHKQQILELQKQVFILSPQQMEEIQEAIDAVADTDTSSLEQIDKVLRDLIGYQQDVLTQLAEKDPHFNHTLSSLLQGLYKTAVHKIEAAEKMEAEDLLTFEL